MGDAMQHSLEAHYSPSPSSAFADGAPQSTLQHFVLSISHTITVFPSLSVCLSVSFWSRYVAEHDEMRCTGGSGQASMEEATSFMRIFASLTQADFGAIRSLRETLRARTHTHTLYI